MDMSSLVNCCITWTYSTKSIVFYSTESNKLLNNSNWPEWVKYRVRQFGQDIGCLLNT